MNSRVPTDTSNPDLGAIPANPGSAPAPHASTHKHGGSDEVATVTPGANAIPKAVGTGFLADGWLSNLIARITDLTWSNLTGKPSTFPPSTHGHSESDITNLASDLSTLASGIAGKAATGDSRFPSTAEKAALAGTSGTPGSDNKFVTAADLGTYADMVTAYNEIP